VITDGDLLGEKTKVKIVFVDGRKFDVRDTPPPARPGDGTGAAPTPTATTLTMTGRWNLTASTPQGAHNATADITMGADGALAGTITTDSGISPISSGSLTGNRFTFTTSINTGSGPLPVTFTGTLDGNAIKGAISSTRFNGDLSGTRPTGPTSSNPDDDLFGVSGGDDDDHSGRDAHGRGDGHRHGRGGRQ
jgi:hypothetical protein